MVRKIVLSAVVAMLAVPAFANAQSSQVGASAQVGNYSNVSGSGDLAFGVLSRATDNEIDAAGGAGSVTRTVDFNHNIAVTFDNVPANLATAGGLLLPITLTCASQTGVTWSTAVACSSAQLDLDVADALSTATLGFGGLITAADVSNAVAGTYTGSFDIVVTAR